MSRIFYLFVCSIFLCCNSIWAQPIDTLESQGNGSRQAEGIINFHSDISIDTSGLVKVAEHIKVYAAGDRIVHGIVRSIPLFRKDKLGTHKRIDFEILSVTKNGTPEPYKGEKDGDNRKIYAGEAEVYLESGIYEYVITYQSRGHVGFFDGYDELYWNVTGNEWDFNIEKASAKISFPAGAVAGNNSCYTGALGSTAQQCSSTNNADGSVSFSSNHELTPGEGFTVAVAFTPNIIKRPGLLGTIYNDYLNVAAGALMIMFFALLYYILWRNYGKDPVKPVVIPTFHIPMGWSPGMVRYFNRKSYDDKAASAALINMAVKGAIKITSPDGNRTAYKFTKTNPEPVNLSEDEKVLFDGLLKTREHIYTTETHAKTFVSARKKFAEHIYTQLNLAQYYAKNNGTAIWITLLTLLALAAYLILIGDGKPLIMLFMLPFIVIGISIVRAGIKKFKKSLAGGVFLLILGLVITILPTGIGVMIFGSASPVTIIIVLVMVALYMTFIYTIRAFTVAGIKIQADIDGFKLYLSTAEKHRLDLLNLPEHTPQVFEKFLPYAIALDLENAWGEKFEEILAQTNYAPDWYEGKDIPYYRFTSAMPSSFYNSVSITPAPADSGSSSGSSGSSSWSSGSSGGGSSGGGGGGGGGGGW